MDLILRPSNPDIYNYIDINKTEFFVRRKRPINNKPVVEELTTTTTTNYHSSKKREERQDDELYDNNYYCNGDCDDLYQIEYLDAGLHYDKYRNLSTDYDNRNRYDDRRKTTNDNKHVSNVTTSLSNNQQQQVTSFTVGRAQMLKNFNNRRKEQNQWIYY